MFYFYRQVIKKCNSKLSIWVILDWWSIKVKQIDEIALKCQPKRTDTLYFSYFSTKTYVVKALLMITHNICFHGEIRTKNIWSNVQCISIWKRANLRVNIFCTSWFILIDRKSVIQIRWSTMKFWPIPNTIAECPVKTDQSARMCSRWAHM